MKKYWEFARAAFLRRTAYRFDALMQASASLSRVLFAHLLWSVLFRGRETISGFTYDAMLTYYLLQSFLAQLDTAGRQAEEMSAQIRDGAFAKSLVIPAGVQKVFFAQSLGASGFTLLLSVASGAVWCVLFQIRLALTPSAWQLASALLLILLGGVFSIQFHFFLSTLAFRYQDISLFLMIKSNLLAFASGTLVPLALLPPPALLLMKLLPFYHATYLPCMLLLNRNGEEAMPGIFTLLLWCGFMYAVNKTMYARLRIRFDGVGI